VTRLRRWGRWPAGIVATLLLGLVLAADAVERPVAFPNTGGEAWTFGKRVAATVQPGACDEIRFSSPRGVVTVRPVGTRVSAEIPLQPGANLLVAECRQAGHRRGATGAQDWFVPLADAPKAEMRVTATPSGITLDATPTHTAPVRAVPITRYEWRAAPGNPAALPALPAIGAQIAIAAPARDGEYAVSLRVADAFNRTDESRVLFRVTAGKAEAVDLAHEAPAWAKSAIVYGVIPSLFGPRGFDDVTARLDELAALGVTALWLSPITAAPEDDFGYAVTDHFRLRGNFGSEADLCDLIAAAHARGLKVIMDFVPNHVSERHRYFADVAARGNASPYASFFESAPAHYFDWDNLENLEYDNPEVRRLMLEAFRHWVRSFDVDGFRVDVAWGPRQRAPDFWPALRAELKRMKPDLLLLAEAPARDPYYFENGFDAAYDWTDMLGEWAWRKAFDDPPHTARLLHDAIAKSLTSDPDDLVFRFLNNNDTGARFVTRYGPQKTRVAAAMLLTLPGLPGLYTGDETGAAYEPYDEGAPLARENRSGLKSWYAQLIALRREQRALRGPALRFLDTPENVLGYVRPAVSGGGEVLVFLNYGPDAKRIELPAGAGELRDLLSGESLTPRNGVALTGHDVRILAPPGEGR
jgi:cyclomaltodextrinase